MTDDTNLFCLIFNLHQFRSPVADLLQSDTTIQLIHFIETRSKHRVNMARKMTEYADKLSYSKVNDKTVYSKWTKS